MTELQEENFKHAERELVFSHAAVAKLEAEREDQQRTIDFTLRKMEEIKRNLSAAAEKFSRAQRRFDFAVSELVPVSPMQYEVFERRGTDQSVAAYRR